MATFDKDTTENTARPRGSGGPLQSKSLDADAGAADAPQQPEDENQPKASDQATPDRPRPA